MSDYERIRVMWPDHLGLARGKYLPARLAGSGTAHCATTFALGYDRSMIPAPGAFLLEGLKDVVSTFDPSGVRPGWEDERTGVAVGHLSFEGRPYTFSARHALQEAVADWEALGYAPEVGLELEAYVIEPDGQGGWRPWKTPRSFVYATGRAADPIRLIDDIVTTADRSGLTIESTNAEFDESQFELTLEHDHALAAADAAFLFRVLAREVTLERGLDLTFLGKPFTGLSGSGVHVNFSLQDRQGTNAMNDPAGLDGLSDLARHCLGGLIRHHEALTALCAPTVNAYRRLQPGELNGYWANWGHEHRCAGNRIPSGRGKATRIENRIPDGACNLHLAVAAVLQAARLGVEAELACPDPLTSDGFEDVNTDRCAPQSLHAALGALEADQALVEAVGRDVCENFLANKHAEWDRYVEAVGQDRPGGEVTEWELDQYLMYH